jgi:hypothetical protein
MSGNRVYQDLFGGNCEAAAQKISWALCRIPVRPFDYIVKAGHPKTVTGEVTNWHVNARTVRESNIEASSQSRLYFPGASFGGMPGIDVFREIRK